MKPKRKKGRIVVALSGGVDSSCAAIVLKEQGYDVVGITYKMWPKEDCGSLSGKACCSLEAIVRARAVAEKLEIPYYVLDFSEAFRKEVIEYFCGEYARGRTPNPCVLCNEKIKFGLLQKKARELGADTVATGHYARLGFNAKRGRYILRESATQKHDQSYFLFSLSQQQLRHILFPLDRFTKSDVRSISKRHGLITHDTASSQDICFAQDLGYTQYLMKKVGVTVQPGEIVDKDGKLLGKHKGIPFYTIGQRKRLGIAFREPLYVVAINAANNRLVAGTKEEVRKRSIIVEKINWVSVAGMKKTMRVAAKIRYQHAKAAGRLTKLTEDTARLDFEKAQEAPTPGQAAVFYKKDLLLGGGWIKEAIG